MHRVLAGTDQTGKTYAKHLYELVGNGAGVVPYAILPVDDSKADNTPNRVREVARTLVSLNDNYHAVVSTVFTGHDVRKGNGSSPVLFETTVVASSSTLVNMGAVLDVLHGGARLQCMGLAVASDVLPQHERFVASVRSDIVRAIKNAWSHIPLKECPEYFAGQPPVMASYSSTLGRKRRHFHRDGVLEYFSADTVLAHLTAVQLQHLSSVLNENFGGYVELADAGQVAGNYFVLAVRNNDELRENLPGTSDVRWAWARAQRIYREQQTSVQPTITQLPLLTEGIAWHATPLPSEAVPQEAPIAADSLYELNNYKHIDGAWKRVSERYPHGAWQGHAVHFKWPAPVRDAVVIYNSCMVNRSRDLRTVYEKLIEVRIAFDSENLSLPRWETTDRIWLQGLLGIGANTAPANPSVLRIDVMRIRRGQQWNGYATFSRWIQPVVNAVNEYNGVLLGTGKLDTLEDCVLINSALRNVHRAFSHFQPLTSPPAWLEQDFEWLQALHRQMARTAGQPQEESSVYLRPSRTPESMRLPQNCTVELSDAVREYISGRQVWGRLRCATELEAVRARFQAHTGDVPEWIHDEEERLGPQPPARDEQTSPTPAASGAASGVGHAARLESTVLPSYHEQYAQLAHSPLAQLRWLLCLRESTLDRRVTNSHEAENNNQIVQWVEGRLRDLHYAIEAPALVEMPAHVLNAHQTLATLIESYRRVPFDEPLRRNAALLQCEGVLEDVLRMAGYPLVRVPAEIWEQRERLYYYRQELDSASERREYHVENESELNT